MPSPKTVERISIGTVVKVHAMVDSTTVFDVRVLAHASVNPWTTKRTNRPISLMITAQQRPMVAPDFEIAEGDNIWFYQEDEGQIPQFGGQLPKLERAA